MKPASKENHFWLPSFVAHAVRGIVRDQTSRRRVMSGLITAALLMLIVGSTVLSGSLDPHVHAGRFMIFWLSCAWVTVSSLLLAVFDVLTVRARERTRRRDLQQGVSRRATTRTEREDA